MAKRLLPKKEVINLIMERFADNEAVMEYCDLELKALEKKAESSKKVNMETENLKPIVLEELRKVGVAVTVTELLDKSDTLKNYILENGNHITNQKLTSILYSLVDTKSVVQVTNKKKSYFSVSE